MGVLFMVGIAKGQSFLMLRKEFGSELIHVVVKNDPKLVGK